MCWAPVQRNSKKNHCNEFPKLFSRACQKSMLKESKKKATVIGDRTLNHSVQLRLARSGPFTTGFEKRLPRKPWAVPCTRPRHTQRRRGACTAAPPGTSRLSPARSWGGQKHRAVRQIGKLLFVWCWPFCDMLPRRFPTFWGICGEVGGMTNSTSAWLLFTFSNRFAIPNPTGMFSILLSLSHTKMTLV